MTDSLNTPDSNDTPKTVTPVTTTGFTPRQETSNFKFGFALLILVGFVAATVMAFNFSVNVVNDTPLLSDPVIELSNSSLNDLETPVITDEGTFIIPVTEDSVLEIEIPLDAQPGDVINFPLPEGGIVIPPGGQVTFELQSTEGSLQGDGEIVIEITDDGATITDTEGNVTHQDKDGNVVDPPASK